MSAFLKRSEVKACTAFSKIAYVMEDPPAPLKFKKKAKTESQLVKVEATAFLSSTWSWSPTLKVLKAFRQSFKLRKPFL